MAAKGNFVRIPFAAVVQVFVIFVIVYSGTGAITLIRLRNGQV